MYDIAGQVVAWHTSGKPVQLVRVVQTKGFSARAQASAAGHTSGEEPVGELLGTGGELDERIIGEVTEGVSRRLVEVNVTDDQAAGVGLSCGGTARLLVQPSTDVPDQVWGMLRRREPLCLVTEVSGEDVEATEFFTSADVADAARRYGDELSRLFARGVSETAVFTSGGSAIVATALWPVPTMLVVGGGLIADALRDQARLLGWDSRVTDEADVAAVERLSPSDALVVLSHDREVDGPTLAAALSSRCGYVAALGSRRTQAARADWLTGHSVPETDLDRIHGPAGLDIGAHTPAEIAVSITAEIIAGRTAGTGQPLRVSGGPIHR